LCTIILNRTNSTLKEHGYFFSQKNQVGKRNISHEAVDIAQHHNRATYQNTLDM